MSASEASERPQEVGAIIGPVGEMETRRSKPGVSMPEGPGQGGWAGRGARGLVTVSTAGPGDQGARPPSGHLAAQRGTEGVPREGQCAGHAVVSDSLQPCGL